MTREELEAAIRFTQSCISEEASTIYGAEESLTAAEMRESIEKLTRLTNELSVLESKEI